MATNPNSSSSSRETNPATSTVESLFSLSNVDIVSVCDGIITRVASGKISVLAASTGASNMLFLLCDSFSYPLVEQPIMKSDDRLYLLPAGRNSTSSNGIASTSTSSSSSSSSTSSSSSSSSSSNSSTTYVLSISATVPAEDVQQFERLLAEHTNFRTRNTQSLVVERQLNATPSTPSTPSTTTEIVPRSSTSSSSTASSTPTRAIVPHTGASSYLPSSLSHLSVTDVGSGISNGVRLAGTVTASALVVGAEYAGKGVKFLADKAVTIVGKSDKPVHINDETKARLDQARMVSRAAVVVSGAVVVGAATMAKQLGSAVSAAFLSTEYGKNLAASSTSETGQAAKQVAASSLVAFGEIWDGLETAAKVFGTHAADATTHFVGEVYGKEAAVVANKSLALAGDVGMTALNMRNISVGGLIRKTGVETAKEVITNIGEHDAHATPALTNGTGGRTPLLTNGSGSSSSNTASTPHSSNNVANLLPVAAALSTIAATTASTNTNNSSTTNCPSLTDTMAAISILSSAVATSSSSSNSGTPVSSTPKMTVPNKTIPVATTSASTSVSSTSSSTPKPISVPVHSQTTTTTTSTAPHTPHTGTHSISELTAAATRIHPTTTSTPTVTSNNSSSSTSTSSQPSSRRNSDSTNTYGAVNLKHVARDLTK